ncbi:MAG: LysR family transcriptional regulator [Alphaproteobacteria bacterium]|nr:LysR family transcriptional regulator [Alphaproteobacteria bacterium]
MNFDWDDMRVFLALARHSTFSAAAKALDVNYTTVARRIRHLEGQLDVRLFEQGTDGYTLTPEAETVITAVENVEADFLSISRKLTGSQAEVRGELTVTFSTSVGQVLVLPHMAAFMQAYPDIRLRLLSTSEMYTLGTQQADIALRVTKNPPEHLIGQNIASVASALYGPVNSSTIGPLLSLTRTQDEQVQDLLKKQPQLKPGPQLSNWGALRDAILSGMGIGILPCFIGDSDKALKRLDTDIVDNNVALWLLSHPDYKNTARVQVFRRFFAEKLKAAVPLLTGASIN